MTIMIKSFSVDHLRSQLYVSEHCCQVAPMQMCCTGFHISHHFIQTSLMNELTTFVNENPGLPFLSVFVSLYLLRVDLPVALTDLKLLYIQGLFLLTELCLLLPMPLIEVKACPSMCSYIFCLLNVATDFPKKLLSEVWAEVLSTNCDEQIFLKQRNFYFTREN